MRNAGAFSAKEYRRIILIIFSFSNLRDTWKDIIALRDQKCWQQEKSTVKN